MSNNGKKPEPVWPLAIAWFVILFAAIYLLAQILRVVV